MPIRTRSRCWRRLLQRLRPPPSACRKCRRSLESLPPELVRDWMLPDGRARLEVRPKGEADDNEAMRRFARAVLAVEPDAVEGPTAILEAGDTVVRAFVEAGLWALLSIAVLLW